MNIKFIIGEGDKIDTKIVKNNVEKEFDYIELIDALYQGEKLGKCEYFGEVSEDVKKALDKMVNEITRTVSQEITETKK